MCFLIFPPFYLPHLFIFSSHLLLFPFYLQSHYDKPDCLHSLPVAVTINVWTVLSLLYVICVFIM